MQNIFFFIPHDHNLFAFPQESRGVSPCRSGAPEVGLSLQVLALCAERALLLLLTQATLALMSPDTAPRDAQRIRQNMADDMVRGVRKPRCDYSLSMHTHILSLSLSLSLQTTVTHRSISHRESPDP